MNRVLIFRNEMLPRSETFIRAQAMALRKFEPRFAAVHAARNSLDLPMGPILVSARDSLAGKVRCRMFWHTGFAPDFYRQLREVAPLLVHAHFAPDGAAALPICKHLRLPLVVTLHGYDVTSTSGALRSSAEGRLYLRKRDELWDKAAAFLCVSKFIRDKAQERGFPAGKLAVHYTGIDLSLFHPETFGRDANLIVFVGRLVEKKGCGYLLDALKRVTEVHPAAHLAILGTGPMEAELRARARRERLPCEFAGMQSPEVVKRYLAGARVFCVPSVTAANGDSEGLGMVFAEAMAMGTPVASFRHGGIPEIVCDRKTGLLASEGDVKELASNLLRLLRDDRLWEKLSENGIRSMRESFDIERQTAKLEDIYSEVLRARNISGG